jgi:hypothetical protein
MTDYRHHPSFTNFSVVMFNILRKIKKLEGGGSSHLLSCARQQLPQLQRCLQVLRVEAG